MLIDCQECEHHECFDCPVAIGQEQHIFVFGGVMNCDSCLHREAEGNPVEPNYYCGYGIKDIEQDCSACEKYESI